MKKVDTNNIIGSDGSDSFEYLPKGVYECVITEAVDHEDTNEVEFVLDIASGNFANYYGKDFYKDKDNNWRHSVKMVLDIDRWGKDRRFERRKVSYKQEWAFVLEAITEQNNGFDAKAAAFACKLEMFKNKKCLVAFHIEEIFNKKTNSFEMSNDARPYKLIKIEQAQYYESPKDKKMSDNAKRKALERAGFDGSTIEQMLNGGAQQSAVAPTPVVDDSDCPF